MTDRTGELAAAVARLREAGTARRTVLVEHGWSAPDSLERPQGRIQRALTGAAKAAGWRVWKVVSQGVDFRRMEGVIDLPRRRYMLDHRHWAILETVGLHWSGRSGRLLDTLPPATERRRPSALWLLDLLAGVTAAEEAGVDVARGDRCRRLAAVVDLGVPASVAPGAFRAPLRNEFSELFALPVDVWIDEVGVRRGRSVEDDDTFTLELWDYGVDS